MDLGRDMVNGGPEDKHNTATPSGPVLYFYENHKIKVPLIGGHKITGK